MRQLLIKMPAAQMFVLLSFWTTFAFPALGMVHVMERVLVAILASICFLFLLAYRTIPRTYLGMPLDFISFPLLAVSFLYLATYFYFISIGQIITGMRDFIEIARYPLWLLFLSGMIAAQKAVHADWFIKWTIIPSIYFSALCFLLYVLPIPTLSNLVHTIYSGTKTAIGFPQWIQWTIPFGNPNFAGLYLVLVTAVLLFFTKRVPIPASLLGLLLVFTSGSRTAWIAASFVILMWLLASVLTVGKRRSALFMVAILSIGVLTAVSFNPYIFSEMARVQALDIALEKGGILAEPNLAARIQQIQYLVPVFLQSPILGFGPSKHAVVDIVDNQYLLWLIRTGLVGTISIILALSFLFIWPITFYRRNGDFFKTMGILAFVGATAISLLTGSFLESLRILFLFFSITVFIIGNPRRLQLKGKE